MLGNRDLNRRLMWWRGRMPVAVFLSFSILTGGCSTGSIGAPDATEATEEDASASTAMSFFAVSSAKAPQIVVGAQSEFNCPPVEIRQGASTLAIGPTGENTTMSLKYQGSFLRVARECAVAGGDMVIKVGIQGRVVVGPAGGPGDLQIPLRIAVVQEAPGGFKPIVTKLIRIPVTIAPGQGNAVFSHVEQGMSFPLPTPTSSLDEYIVYVGFDPLAAESQEAPKPRPKAKAKPGQTKPNPDQ